MAGQAYGASSRFARDFAGKVIILTYHRVIPSRELAATVVQPGMYVTSETFERHLEFMAARFQVISLSDLLDLWERRSFDTRASYCAITFDDGWLDNYRYAYPLLRKHVVPATIFLSTDLIGTDETLWSDRLITLLYRSHPAGTVSADDCDALIERAKQMTDEEREALLSSLAATAGPEAKRERMFMNWDEVRTMSKHGTAFGSHTCSHTMLTRLLGPALERELRRPVEVLAEQQVNYVPVLSYPNGDHSPAVVKAAQTAGYRAAVTTDPGVESSQPSDLFRLTRVGIHDDVSRSLPLLSFHIGYQIRRGLRKDL